MVNTQLNKISDTYFDIFEEEVEFGNEKLKMVVARNKNGVYIGKPEDAYFLLKKYNIQTFEPALSKDSVCSIGFAPAKDPDKDVDKWYGWSHRAIFGFEIGSIAEEGDCCTTSGIVEKYQNNPENKEELEAIIPVGFEAKNLEDCKKMAIAFANSVS